MEINPNHINALKSKGFNSIEKIINRSCANDYSAEDKYYDIKQEIENINKEITAYKKK